MNANNWIRLTSFSDRLQANLTVSLLQGSGIPVQTNSDDAGGLYAPLTVASGIDLFVPEDRLSEAQELLNDVS